MKELITIMLLFFTITASSQKTYKVIPRTIVTTDGEIDDVDTFIRMLLYSNEYKVEGLVYSSSMWHYKGDEKGTLFTSEMEMTKQMYGARKSLRWPGVHWIQDLLEGYEKVHSHLILHDKNFPTPNYLKSIVKVGNINFEGEMEKETEGSQWIKNKLLDNNSSPIYLQAWGGTNTIARALKSIEEENKHNKNWPVLKEKISQKAIIYTVMDQDATYKKYIGVNWPQILVFYNAQQFGSFAYPWKRTIPLSMQSYFEGNYMSNNIIHNHGALLEMYYSYGDGKKQVGDEEHIHGDINKLTNAQWGSFKQYDFISEGDSPAFLQLVDMGLDNVNHPTYGGWGGRFVKSSTNPFRFEDGASVMDYNPELGKMDANFPQTRWLVAVQEDFAARANWCVNDLQHANHAPVINIKAPNFKVKAGATIELNPTITDPDGNQVNLKYWQYQEAGNTEKKLNIVSASKNAIVKIPADAKSGDIFHLIIEGKDNGTPSLTKYKRIVINVL